MKTSLADYLLSTLALSVLLAASVWPVWILSAWSSNWFGDYHVLVDLALVLLFYGVLSALAIRVLLRLHPMQPGTYSMDSPTFTWWKLITVLYHFGQCALKPLTPIFLTPLVAMLYGAKVGSDVALGGIIDAPFAVTIGDRVTVGAFALVSGNFTSRESLILGTVTIGSGATIGVNAVVSPNTEIGENAVCWAALVWTCRRPRWAIWWWYFNRGPMGRRPARKHSWAIRLVSRCWSEWNQRLWGLWQLNQYRDMTT